MKKALLILTIVFTMAISEGFSQTKGIRFIEKPWTEIVAMAKKENKLIFLDGYASWCGPCKWMASNIFTNDSVGDYYNRTFICASIDMEKGEGIALKNTYDIRAYPTLLFLTADGKMVHKRVGAAQKVQDYLDMGGIALSPEHCYATCLKKYKSGVNTPEFIYEFCQRLSDAYTPMTEVLQNYFPTQTEDKLQDRTNWNIIRKFVSDMDSPVFAYLLNHREEYVSKYTKDSVDNKISEVFLNALVKQTRSAQMTDDTYNALKKKIKDTGYPGADKICVTSDLMLYQMRGDKQKFLDLACDKVDKLFSDDYNMLNNFAWNVSELSTDSKYLNKALSWAKQSIQLKDEAFNNDTYARLLYKSGKKDEARKYERIAIARAREKHLSVTEYETSLKAME